MNEGGGSDYKALKEMGLINGNKDVQNEIDIIRSFSLMRRVVDSLNLNISLYKEGRVTASPIFGNDMPVTFKVVDEYKEGKPETYKLILNSAGFNLSTSAEKGGRKIKYGEVFEVGMGKYTLTKKYDFTPDAKYQLQFEDKINKS